MELYAIFIFFSTFLCISPKFCNECKFCIFLENKQLLSKKLLVTWRLDCYGAVSALNFPGGDDELPSVKLFVSKMKIN